MIRPTQISPVNKKLFESTDRPELGVHRITIFCEKQMEIDDLIGAIGKGQFYFMPLKIGCSNDMILTPFL